MISGRRPRTRAGAGNRATMRKTGGSILTSTPPLEITPQEVKRSRDAGAKVVLIDVREPAEFQLARIQGAQLIPMRTVPAELQLLESLADDNTLVVYCHHGVRSQNVVNWLREQGVSSCQSMAGGIDRWSREIDPSVPLYS
jgi:rhodanese-related sulfurtransferase